jgi:hypothetical protein
MKTIRTGVTGYMMMNKYTISWRETIHLFSHIRDLTCGFMTKPDR